MKQISEKIGVRQVIAIVLIILALLSFFPGADYFSSPDFHAKTIEKLDEKKTTVMELTAGATAVSAAISLLPNDAATPIAEKLADISTYLLWVLCAIYLEKYLVTITGFAAFKLLFPIACICMAVFIFTGKPFLRRIASQLAIFGLAIFLVIPASVKVSDMIENTYQASIQSTMDSATDAAKDTDDADGKDDADGSDDASGTESGAASEDANTDANASSENSDASVDSAASTGWTDWISNAVNNVKDYADSLKEGVSEATDSVTETISDVASGKLLEKAEDAMNKFIEAAAVLIVTSCIIPILVLVFFFWLLKILLEMNMDLPMQMPPMPMGPGRHEHKE